MILSYHALILSSSHVAMFLDFSYFSSQQPLRKRPTDMKCRFILNLLPNLRIMMLVHFLFMSTIIAKRYDNRKMCFIACHYRSFESINMKSKLIF